MIYLDHNATTYCDPEVVKEMLPYFTEKFYNPSSVYTPSQEAKDSIETSREKVAKLLGCHSSEIIFTAGGSESINMAIIGTAYALKNKGNHIITSKIEHHAVLHTCKFLEELGFEVSYIGVDKYGFVDIEQLEKSITPKTILISIMYANNEIGTIQPIEEISKIAKNKGVLFHTDAVQVVGKIPFSVKNIGADMLSLSAHKFYGPKGIGSLYIKKGLRIKPLIHGGGQERNLRAGTENVPAIVGMGKACELAEKNMEKDSAAEKELRDMLEKNLLEKIPEILINGHTEKRLYNTSNVGVKYVEGEGMLLNLDFEGICASSGSACTSGSLDPSHVLLAIGVSPEDAHGSLRFSFGRKNTRQEVEKVAEVLPPIVQKLRQMSPFWNKK
jgi:cysteine desulfurase